MTQEEKAERETVEMAEAPQEQQQQQQEGREEEEEKQQSPDRKSVV